MRAYRHRFQGPPGSRGIHVPALALLGFCIAGAISTAAARTWIIRPDGSGDAPTIQAAILSSSHDDTVLVAPGTYQENLQFHGKKIVVGSLYLTDPDPAYIQQTVIDGSGHYSSVVRFLDAEESGSVLCGMTLTGGHGTQEGFVFGGGIFVSGASPTLRDLVIRQNMWAGMDEFGGGLAILYGSPLVERCVIEDNEAYTGGGLDIEGSGANPLIRDSVIRGNRARISSAVDIFYGASPRFERVNILANSPIGTTATMQVSYGRVELVNTTLADNAGPGLGLLNEAEAVLANTIVWGNTFPQITVYNGSALAVAYSDVQGGAGGIEQVPGSEVNWLEGNINLDPHFVDAAAGDYRLQPTSPCLNAGVAHLEWGGRTIVDLKPEGYCGSAPDMGAFEICPEPAATPHAPEVDERRETLWVVPNPSPGSTSIRFVLERPGSVEVEIRDVTGRRLRSLGAGNLASGVHEMRWDGRDDTGREAASGVYWAHLRTGAEGRTRKIIVTR